MVLESLKGLRGILSIWNVEGRLSQELPDDPGQNPNFKTRDVVAKTLKFNLDIDSQKLHIWFFNQHLSGASCYFWACKSHKKGMKGALEILESIGFHFAGFVSAPKKSTWIFQTSHVQSTQGEVTSCKMDVGDIFREAGSEAGGASFVGPRLFRMHQRCSESRRAAPTRIRGSKWFDELKVEIRLIWLCFDHEWMN